MILSSTLKLLFLGQFITVTCILCGRSMRKTSYRRHVIDRHMPAKNETCKYCNKVFKGKNSLRTHIAGKHRELEAQERKNKSQDFISLSGTADL